MAAPASRAELGFSHHAEPGGLLFSVENWVPGAYLLLLVLLLWRFARTMRPARAILYAAAGAWLGSLAAAATLCMIQWAVPHSVVLEGVVGRIAIFEAVLSALTLLAVGLCALRLRGEAERDEPTT